MLLTHRYSRLHSDYNGELQVDKLKILMYLFKVESEHRKASLTLVEFSPWVEEVESQRLSLIQWFTVLRSKLQVNIMVSEVSGATSGNLIGKEWESAYCSREIIMGLDKSEHVHSLTAAAVPLLGEATFLPSNESISSLNEEHRMPASIIYLSRR